MKDKRPNIIFIISDQHNHSVIKALGDNIVKTPNLDSLVNEGTSLTQCYCGAPVCVPSRMSLLTGQLPSQNGIYNNQQSLRFEQVTIAHTLTASNYKTVLCGRMHIIGEARNHGFQEVLVGDVTGAALIRKDGSVLGDIGPTAGQNIISVDKSGAGMSNYLIYDEDVINGACKYLEDYKNEQPLFMTVGLVEPHCPYICPKELFDYYYNKVEVEENYKEFRENLHPAMIEWFNKRGILDVTSKDIRRVKAAYYGMVTHMDKLIGKLLKKIDQTIKNENTIIIYASDHGELMGQHGMFWKSNFYEGSVKVPLIFKNEKYFDKNRIINSPTSLLDLAPTLCELTNSTMLPNTFGRSLLDVLFNKVKEDDNRIIISQLVDSSAGSAMIRKNNYKLIKYFGYDEVQLFDLENDKKELNDLGTNLEFLKIKEELLSDLFEYWDEKKEIVKQEEHKNQLKILLDSLDKYDFNFDYEWSGNKKNNYIIK